MPESTEPLLRRALREARAQAGRRERRRLWWAVAAAVVVLALIVGVAVGVTQSLSNAASAEPGPGADAADAVVFAVPASVLPVPQMSGSEASGATSTPTPDSSPGPDGANCDDEAVAQALDSGDDAAVIEALGGAESFRTAIADGEASCVSLTDTARVWVLVNKRQPLDPADYWPEPQARPESVQRTSGGHMRADAAAALSELAEAAAADGVGAIGINSGFRPYNMQVSTYNNYVAQRGVAAADLTSARPGFSEHQTGLAADIVACSGGCGSIEAFGGTSQSEWVAENAWRFGFVVRYEEGRTEVTGYEYEPWHLRYIGTDLAAAYNEGGYTTLEEFFGQDAAPDYGD